MAERAQEPVRQQRAAAQPEAERQASAAEQEPQAASTRMVAEANDQKARDNITAIVARFDTA